MAADPADVANLARKLRGKGLTDDQVRESLTGLGYTKPQAAAALAASGSSNPPAGPAPTKAVAKTTTRKGSRRPAAAAKPAAGGVPGPPAAGTTPAGGGSATGGSGLTLPSLPSLPSPTLTPPKRLQSGDLGGFMAGLLLYTLALNYLRYGPEGVTGWLGAKFLNKPAAIAPPAERDTGERAGSSSSIQQAGFTSTRPAAPKEV